jgi:membrane-bound lytic murein transglycosylase MltF
MSRRPSLLLACLALARPAHRSVKLETGTRTGDFDMMLEQRILRIGVPYSRSLYYLDQGRERGITAELAREFERWYNARERKQLKGRPLSVVLVPTTRDQLLPRLVAGRLDVAGGNLTSTLERRKQADFILPGGTSDISEILVTGPGAPPLQSIDDLSGKTVHARPGTSYYRNLERLDARFRALRRPPLDLVALPDALEDEDKLEMVNAGVLQIAVVDDWLGRIWAPTLPNVMLREDLVLRSGQQTGWAIRKDSPQMAALLQEFFEQGVKSRGLLPVLRGQLGKRVRDLGNNTASGERDRFEQTIGLFRKYGGQYHLDPLLLSAQGYQESRLRQETRSPTGAVGVMQVMPKTGTSLKVGDVRKVEPNIHAGTKYMDQLMSAYFQDARFDEMNRTLFAFAAYNAGPGKIARMRRIAGERGLDPDVWFNNVELVTADLIGVETTTYVRNILKYYVSYRLIEDSQQRRRNAIQGVAGASR